MGGEPTLDGPTQTLPALYSLPVADFHDITVGPNGYYAAPGGYDEVTGLGTPVANLLVPALAGYSTTTHDSAERQRPVGDLASTRIRRSLFSTANGDAITLADAAGRQQHSTRSP